MFTVYSLRFTVSSRTTQLSNIRKPQTVNRKPMKAYRHLFFDLDNTLWDFDRNSSETLNELYIKYKLHEHGIESAELFIQKYQERNAVMWDQYRLGKIDKET